MPGLSNAASIEYIKDGGGHCPYCHKGTPEADEAPTVEGGLVWQDIQCSECGHQWRDVYFLERIEEYEEEPATDDTPEPAL